MTRIKTFNDLNVYKKSLVNLEQLYEIAYKIPHIKLRTQLINSGEAIPPLIAEGFAKQRNPRESSRYYEMAMAESDEVVAHLTKAIILSKRFFRIPKPSCEELVKEYTTLSKQLNKLSTVWRNYEKF